MTTSISSPFSMLRSLGVWFSWRRSPSKRNRTLFAFSCIETSLLTDVGNTRPSISWVGWCSWSWRKLILRPVLLEKYLGLDLEVELFGRGSTCHLLQINYQTYNQFCYKPPKIPYFERSTFQIQFHQKSPHSPTSD